MGSIFGLGYITFRIYLTRHKGFSLFSEISSEFIFGWFEINNSILISIFSDTIISIAIKALIARANTSSGAITWINWFPLLLLLVMVKLRIVLLLFFLLFFLQLSLVVGFVVYLLKTRKPFLRCNASLAFEQVY